MTNLGCLKEYMQFVNTVNVAILILQLSYGLASIFVNRHFLTAGGIYKMLCI